MDPEFEKTLRGRSRAITPAVADDAELGPFQRLPGEWSNDTLPGRGWNLIALPFASAPGAYRLLLNQYNETLRFSVADKGAPNRGIEIVGGNLVQRDQFVLALDYEQLIVQIAAADHPVSGRAGDPGLPIHKEPGLFLRMTEPVQRSLAPGEPSREVELELARLATIPHGDSVLALGGFEIIEGPPDIPGISGLPVGVDPDIDTNPYLAPYKIFRDHPFEGVFDPSLPNALLDRANQGVNILRTTRLWFDTEIETAGILNLPFVTRQANAASMRSTFWIQEIEDDDGKQRLRLQYSQVVMLDFFFTRGDGMPGRVRWPHISINTMERKPVVPAVQVALPSV